MRFREKIIGGILIVLAGGLLGIIIFTAAAHWDLRAVRADRESLAHETIYLKFEMENFKTAADRREKALRQAAAVIRCESGGRHDGVWGDGGRSYGIAQYQRRTFYALAEEAGLSAADWKSREDQVQLLVWAIENGRAGEWTCWRKLFGRKTGD